MAERETIADLKPGDYKKTPAKETFDELKFNERWPTTEMAQYHMQDPPYDPTGMDYILSANLSLKEAQGLSKLHEKGRQPTTDELIRVFNEGSPWAAGPGRLARGAAMVGRLLAAPWTGARSIKELTVPPTPYIPRRVPTKEYI